MAHKNSTNWSPYKSSNTSRDSHKPGEKSNRRRHRKSQRGTHRRPQRIFSFSEADDRLQDLLFNHGWEGRLSTDQRHQFVRFYHLLMKTQHRENFTRLLSLKDIAIKHFIDSLMVTQQTELCFPLLDMGTGPGFPGIPLRIFYPGDRKIILAEGVQRRIEFLKKVRAEMDLKNLHLIGRNVNKDFIYPVQGVITRAVEDARNTLGNVINCLPVGGKVFLMKGPNVGPEIPVAKQAWGHIFKLEQDIAYSLPQSPHKRRLLVYRKWAEPDGEQSQDGAER